MKLEIDEHVTYQKFLKVPGYSTMLTGEKYKDAVIAILTETHDQVWGVGACILNGKENCYDMKQIKES